ncbi:MAG: glycosyltransferase [Planctomycetaceae bacterium]|nr:glycosyltransferase [Planctomycetaceae bacterium]
MSAPARVAFVITELEVGGAERCLANLATRIDRARFEPMVISLAPRPAAGKDELVAGLEQAGVSVRFLNRRSAWQITAGFALLSRILQDQRPQIVQTFLYHANVLGALAAKRAHVPHVLAGVRVADPRWWRAWSERWACSAIERFVCVSDGVAQHCLSRGYPREKLVVIPNGVDIDRFSAAKPIPLAELGVGDGRKAIVYIGRLDAQKGLDDLLRAFPRVIDALPGHDLLLVGDGPERHALTKLAVQLGISSRVHLAGWRADVPAILAAAELLVLPSRWEGMPNVVLEAMAAGKPVVANRVEGVAELLGPSTSDQCVAPQNGQALGERIIQLVQNPQIAADLGKRNRERAVEKFSIGAMVAKYEQLYASVLGR